MSFNFERFTKFGGSFSPTISIRKQGTIGFSQGALNRFGLLEGEWFVVLFYDKAANVIGIMPTRSESEEGATRLRRRTSIHPVTKKESFTTSISAKAFLDYYGIPSDRSRSFLAKQDAETKMIIVDLKQELKGEPADQEVEAEGE